jgi:Ca2+-binding RTX toxin-like protein
MANITGTAGNDTITGTAGADSIDGSSGNDSIQAGDGMDTVQGNTGNDTISGNAGTDWVEGDTGNDEVRGGSGQDSIAFREYGDANADQLTDFDAGWDNIQLDASAFTQIGAAGRMAAGDPRFFSAPGATSGHDADDRIVYNSTTGQLYYDADGSGPAASQLIATITNHSALAPTDIWVFGTPTPTPTPTPAGTINGTSGDDSLVGTNGDDTINGLDGNDTIRGLDGNDSLDGGTGNDSVDGGAGNDTIAGNQGDDTLLGGAGNDSFNMATRDSSGVHNPDNDVIDGGDGFDSLFFSFGDTFGSGAVTLDMAAGTYSVAGDGAGTFTNIESVRGSFQDDRLSGTEGADNISGSFGNDTIIGLGGNDSLAGGGGNDSVLGGAGDDTLTSFGGDGFYDGGDGNDLIGVADGNDTISGGAGDDHIDIAARVVGGGPNYGDKVIDGGSGIDSLTMEVFSPVTVNLETGTLSGGGFNAGGNSSLISIENFAITNGGGPAQITGSSDANFLQGGSGNDTIDGRAGIDTLIGGAGADQFLFTTVPGPGNGDLIEDFSSSQGDKIHLDARVMTQLGASGNFAPDDPRFYAAPGANGGHDADDRVILDTSTNQIFYDPDGNGAAAAQIIASIHPSGLSASDIVVDNGTTPTPTPSPTPTPTPPPPGSIVGTPGNDDMSGTNGNDSIYGLGGNDTIFANGGDDWVQGGAGNDSVSGGSGQDQYAFAEYGTANADQILNFGSGWDGIQLDAAGFSNIGAPGRFAGGDVRFFSGAGATSGHDADDRIVYNTSSGQLFYDADGSGSGAAQLIATFQGNPGMAATDINVFGTATPSPTPSPTPTPAGTINGTSGNDTLVGTDAPETINGLGGNDSIVGNGAADSMSGGDGNDTLDAVTGQDRHDVAVDTLDGGLGDDTYRIFNNTVVHDDPGGLDTVLLNIDGEYTMPGGVENLSVVGESNDNVGIIGNGLDNIITTLSAVYRIDAGAGNDTINAGLNNDRLAGGAGNDVINAGEGFDFINGGLGNDTLTGGHGTNAADTFAFDAAPGAANADVVTDFSEADADRIQLDGSVMPALGASGSFAAGDARFFAAAGANGGHDADDRVVYNTSTGQLWYDADGSGGSVAQLIATLQGAPGLAATDIDVVNGNTTPTPTPGTSLNGTNGDDTLVGTAGNDTIFGNSGNDWIEGRGGNDTLSGGSGMDSYVFREFGAANADTLNNFDSGNWDTLRFDNAAFTALGPDGHFSAGDARFFAAAGATGGHDADDRIVYNTTSGQLYYDADGAGGADAQLVATIQGAAPVAAPDIWVI